MEPRKPLIKDEQYENFKTVIAKEVEASGKLSPFIFEGEKLFAEAAIRVGRKLKEYREQKGWHLEVLVELSKDIGDINPYDLLRYYNFYVGVEAHAKNLPSLRTKEKVGAKL